MPVENGPGLPRPEPVVVIVDSFWSRGGRVEEVHLHHGQVADRYRTESDVSEIL